MKGGVLAVVVALGACAAQKPVTKSEAQPAPSEPKRTKMAVLPVDSDAFPKLAIALNAHLRTIQARGIDDYFLSKVTLEVVQLSIECVEGSNDCWSAVGRSLPADRLLLAQIQRGPKKRDKSLKLIVTYFDVASGQPLHVAEKQFKNEDEATRSLEEVVAEALGDEPSRVAKTGEHR